MSWKLFLDDDAGKPGMFDFRNPPQNDDSWKVAHSTSEAMTLIDEHGIPEFIDFDHDLGGLDSAMVFLKMLEMTWPNAILDISGYRIHSANPVGAENIGAFMESWKKSLEN